MDNGNHNQRRTRRDEEAAKRAGKKSYLGVASATDGRRLAVIRASTLGEAKGKLHGATGGAELVAILTDWKTSARGEVDGELVWEA